MRASTAASLADGPLLARYRPAVANRLAGSTNWRTTVVSKVSDTRGAKKVAPVSGGHYKEAREGGKVREGDAKCRSAQRNVEIGPD